MEFNDRQDYDLAYMLRFENIAWYEDGTVSILDRRIYPIETKKLVCKTYTEVVKAIAEMVTQSEGPYIAACHGLVLAVHEAIATGNADIMGYAKKAAYELTHARPTTQAQMTRVISGCLDAVKIGLEHGDSSEALLDRVRQAAYDFENNNYRKYGIIGENIANLIPNGSTILTQCFGGTVVGTMLRACKNHDKSIKVVCAETRPYYQGARLTASVACDMGFDVTVISDNMIGASIKNLGIGLFTSASDVITCEGDVVNKVGTMQMAIMCDHFGIPYYCTGTPDAEHKNISSVHIELRDPELVLKSLNTKITMDGVKGYYPAFDVTPSRYVTGIVTEKGVYAPKDVHHYFED